MNTALDQQILKKILESLDNILIQAVFSPITLVICGGGAMVALGLTGRRTNDIDVIDPVLDPTECVKKPETVFSPV